MKTVSHPLIQNRRTFCAKLLAAGAVSCIGCAKLLAMAPSSWAEQEPPAKDKFSEDSKMSFKEVYKFAYRDYFIPMMLGISAEVGREKAVEMFKKVTAEKAAKEGREWAKEIGKNDLESYVADLRKPDYFSSHVRTLAIVEDTKQAFGVKITECLWAKTFRTAGAPDIGYACLCYSDYAYTRAFNPKMQVIRTKTLMQGDAYCNHRYVFGEV